MIKLIRVPRIRFTKEKTETDMKTDSKMHNLLIPLQNCSLFEKLSSHLVKVVVQLKLVDVSDTLPLSSYHLP